MHGQFYSHQHYIQRPGAVQNSTSAPRNDDSAQQGHLRYGTQHAGILNGQSFQAHSGQPQQQRVQQMQHPAAGLAQQQYSQLLQNTSYQALYNQALQQRQQNQTLQANHQQEQQRLLQQQQQQQQNAAEQSATLRTLLASSYHQQMTTLNQLGLGQTSASPHRLGVNLQHTDHLQSAAKTGIPQIPRVVINEPQRREMTRQRETPVVVNQVLPPPSVRNIPSQKATPQAVLNQDILMARHIPPTTPGRNTPGYHQNPNMYPNIMLSPNVQSNTGLISPHRNAYSPAMGHLSNVGANRLQGTPMQMTRTEISTVPMPDHDLQSSYATIQNRSVSLDLQSPPIPTTTSGAVVNANIYVKRQTSSVNSCSAPVIICDSDDDDDDQHQTTSHGRSSERRENQEESPAKPTNFTRVVIDDDIEITGVRDAEIMSHMRPDCPIHMFKRVDTVDTGPQEQNASKCSKCFCYVCDKVATKCEDWSNLSFPHCNAHARASCWKARRNTKRSPLLVKLAAEGIIVGGEGTGEIAMQYMISINEAYITYRLGTPCEYNKVPCNCQCHRSQRSHEPCISCKVVHDMKKKFNYEPVREKALKIIREIQSKYSKNHPETALIMFDAVLTELCSQRPADFNHTSRMPSNPDVRCQCNFPNIVEEYIEKELIEIMTRYEVSTTFRNNLVKCVEDAIKPLQLKDIMKKFLSMRHWDNLLLRAVLSGSNTSGTNGREVLRETGDVIKMRVEKLDNDKRYISILRYLKAVKILQSSKSTISNNQILALIDRWMLLYAAKQGHFKDVVLRLTTPVADQTIRGMPNSVLSTLPPDLLIQLLDALAGKDATQETRLDSFDPKSSQGPYIIKGKDADVLLLLFHFIIHQNKFATNHVPFYLWLARWVNRMPLSPCLDPNRIKPWRDQGSAIVEHCHQAYAHGQCQSLLMQCGVHDPHVHLFNASINIVSAVSKFRNLFQPEHMQSILEAYMNNEWALFHLLTQSALMSYGDVNVIRWITKFCETNNGTLAQIKDRVLIESIQPYPLDNVSDFLKALIKPDWINSIETIQKTVIAVASEYSLRLLDELKRNDVKILAPKGKWLEEIILKYVEEQRIATNLLRDENILNYLKNISKTCSFLNPVRHNIELYRKISPSNEWYRRCNSLIQFLADKFTKEKIDGTIEVFSTFLWLLWSIGDLKRMASYFVMFQDRHSCVEDKSKVTSAKVIEEVASLLDSFSDPNLTQNKRVVLQSVRRLCVLETLSWLTCTECARKMPTGWTKVWISCTKAKLDENLKEMTNAMLVQLKTWLNIIPLGNPDNYNRLLVCLQSFLKVLVTTWQTCKIPLEESLNLLLDVAKVVASPDLRRDFAAISNELVKTELDKLKPKVPEIPVSHATNSLRHEQPSNDLQRQRSAHLHAPVGQPVPQRVVNDAVTFSSNDNGESAPPGGSRDHQRVQEPPERIERQKIPSQQEKVPTSTKVPAVMSTDALFKKTTQNRVVSPQKTTPEKPNAVETAPKNQTSPFSPTTLARTKNCQNCGATISCASFRCPKCNQAARAVQPVICPGCRQENRELKGYSCQFCYRSLLDVLFGGGDQPQVSEEPKVAPEITQRKKKKSSDKRPKKLKRVENNETEENKTEILIKNALEKPCKVEVKKVSPLTVKLSSKSSTLDDSSDSSLDDFVVERPQKKRKRHSSNSKIPTAKRKLSIPTLPQLPQPGSSLTDEDSDSDEADNNTLIIASVEFAENRNTTEKTKIQQTGTYMAHTGNKQNSISSQERGESSTTKPPMPKPQLVNNINKPRSVSHDSGSPQKLSSKMTHNAIAPPPTHNAPPKRGVGHSSMMSKKQKNILSRLKKPGVGVQKVAPTSLKTTPPNSRPLNKELMRSPSGGHSKRPSFDNGPLSSPVRSQMESIKHTDRQRHDSSCSSGSVSSASGFTFGLANVADKRPRNVGHRTGGRPHSAKKLQFQRNFSEDNSASNSKKLLFPQPLNHDGNHADKIKKKKHKRKKEFLLKNPNFLAKRALEKKLNTLLAKRKPGPHSRTNYKRILKLEYRLKKLQRPHPAWRLHHGIKLPPGIDLSLHYVVSLSLFPRGKLHRIQSLVPNYTLDSLYA